MIKSQRSDTEKKKRLKKAKHNEVINNNIKPQV